MSETRIPNMMHIASASAPEGLWLAVVPDRDTGQPTAFMEVPPNSLEMLMALSDGACVIARDDDDKPMPMASISWLRTYYTPDLHEGLDRLEATLREHGMLT